MSVRCGSNCRGFCNSGKKDGTALVMRFERMTWIWEFLGGTSQREEPVGCHCADGLWKALGCTWHI